MTYDVRGDLDEAYEVHAPVRVPDLLSLALGESAFVAGHRFDLQIYVSPGFVSPRLTVTRFYWGATPPTVIDFRRDVRSPAELEAKRAFFADRGIRYVLAEDEFDEDAVRAAVAPPESDAPAQRPMTAPRRRRDT